MYCPKCKETFEKGSRRFCPSDGSRLLSESAEASGKQREGGIFAHLIPKIEPKQGPDKSLSEVPRFVMTEPPTGTPSPHTSSVKTDTPLARQDLGGDFFVLDDIGPDPPSTSIFLNTDEKKRADSKPSVRKINPYDIPAGHVELGGGDRLAVSSAEFQEDNPESFIGRTVKGRYLVTELLGGEDNSFAFLADDKIVDDKKVLVRILLQSEDDEVMGSIIDEERVSLAHVSHPNIARLIDSGQFTDGTRFLISEFVDALSVGDILSIHGRFGVVRTARVIRQIASALNEVHQEGILHRDLRPSNIIVEPGDGDSDHATLVNLGASNGDPTEYNLRYKSPEVLDGRVPTISSDIFSLAVVAFEMLTGELPFKGKTAKDLMRSQYEGLDPLPSRIRQELPSAADIVFKKGLAFKVSGRYVKARDFGDALFAAIGEGPVTVAVPAIPEPAPLPIHETLLELNDSEESRLAAEPAEVNKQVELKPEPPPVTRSNGPIKTGFSPYSVERIASRNKKIAVVGVPLLLALVGLGWYYIAYRQIEPQTPASIPADSSTLENIPAAPMVENSDVSPSPRTIPQPPNTNYYQNTKQNLRGDLLRNFVGFSIYYPKAWKVNGPQESVSANSRGKFLDISRSTADGRLREQMLISYYPSKGTFDEDADKFPQMVRETNETLKRILPGYQMVSEGEIKFNGGWRAYEIKFQGGGTSGSGDKLVVWGRRLLVPVERPDARDGFEVTMLATSAADDVRSVDDVGVRGELAGILQTFEPSRDF